MTGLRGAAALGLLLAVVPGARAASDAENTGALVAASFGVRCDGRTDNAPALNRALKAARERGAGRLVLPAGVCRVADTIGVTTRPYESVTVVGQGKAAPAHGDRPMAADNLLGSGTLIWCDFTDRPCLNISHGRQVTLRDFGVVGNNFGSTDFPEPTAPRRDWVFRGALDRDEAAYCGLCIDPFAGGPPAPGRGYASRDYTGSTGGSSDLTLENLRVTRFVVAALIAPRATTTNADDIRITDSTLAGGVACLAIGQSQSRNVILQGVALGGCRTALDGVTYGARFGAAPKCYGCIFGFHQRLFDFRADTGSQLLLSGCHAESIKSLGVWGPGASGNTGALIHGCNLSLGGVIPANGWRRNIEPITLEAAAPVTIVASGLGMNTSTPTPAINLSGSGEARFVMVGSSFAGSDAMLPRLLVGVSRDLNQGAIRFLDSRLQTQGAYREWSDDGARRYALADGAGRFAATPGQRSVADRSGVRTYEPGARNSYVNLAAGAVTLERDALAWRAGEPDSVLPGDIFLWPMAPQDGGTYTAVVPACQVSDVTAARVRCALFYDRERYLDVGAASGVIGTGVMPLAVEEWAPTVPLTCTTTAGSRQLADCAPTTILRTGDFVAGSGLAADTRIVDRAATATPRLSRAATASGRSSVHFGRLGPVGSPAE